MLDYAYVRLCHGVLMTLAWTGFHVLGSVVGKRLKDENSLRCLGLEPREKHLKFLFWSHVVFQAMGLVLGTAGFCLCLKTFQIPYELVRYKHGTLGIAVMAMAYLQGLMGAFRPKAVTIKDSSNKEKHQFYLRRAFEYFHGALGKVTLVLGLVNCFTGIAMMKGLVDDEAIDLWAAISVAWITCLLLADGIVDKLDKDQTRFRPIREMELASNA